MWKFKPFLVISVGNQCIRNIMFQILIHFRFFKAGDHITLTAIHTVTVGAVRNETLFFINFSAQDASILKISVPIFKRSSWGFQNTPNLWSLDDFWPCYGNLKKINFFQNNFDWRFREGKSKPCFFGCAITRLKIMQTLQVGGVLESSGPPLDDGHRDF